MVVEKQLLPSWEECGPCPVFASYNLALALQLRKSKEKPMLPKMLQ
jgi:hypothetical protein